MKYIFLVNFLTQQQRNGLKNSFRRRLQPRDSRHPREFARLARWRRLHWVALSLLTAWSVLFVPFGSLASRFLPAVVAVPAPPQAVMAQDDPSLLQLGLDLYEAEQYQAAVDHWQQILTRWTAAGTVSRQAAFVFNHLSLAYQQLGQWQAAEAAVQQSLSLLNSIASSTDTAENALLNQEVLAKTLNTQGRLQWHQGEIDRALQTWQQATAAYQQAGDRTGVVMGFINQARALQNLGFSVRAETRLRQVVQLLEQEPDPSLRASGWRHLADVLRRIGNLRESEQILQQSLAEIAWLDAATQSALWLDLGNTQRALGNKAVAIGDTQAAQRNFQAAQTSYQQAEHLATSPLLKLQIKLNQLSLLLETDQLAAATELALQLNSSWNALPFNRSSLYIQLNYARSLTRLNQAASPTQPIPNRDIAIMLATTLQQAQAAADPTVESYALGQLGELYEQTGQWQAAQTLTEQALLKAEAVQAADIRYRWEWQLGRLQEKQGDRRAALVAYQAAVESLQSVRNDLLSIDTDAQFSFRDDVEPVYRGLVELLLSSNGESPSQANLRRAIQQINALQLAELNNFLGCNLAQTVAIDALKVDPAAAKLYPMILPNRLAIVLELPGQPLLYHQVEKPQAEILATLSQLRQDLSAADRTPEAVAGLQQVYDWLIAPFQAALSGFQVGQAQIKTLVFVLDGELRNVPMAALYDGQQYLIHQYAIAIAPRLELFQPSPRPAQLKLFLGGVGEPQTLNSRAFPKIEYLAPELEQIQQILNAKQPLLNEAFTKTNLEQQLQVGEFSAVHLKTHGIFSSDPEETFIVAYQALITSQDLGRLIQLNRFGEASPIELLVLSACSTAQGDNRAVLGLAGVAVQAGARSVVSTLWEAQDLPNTQLMIQFYQALSNPAISRAEALRQAQLHLLEQGYTTPHVWATYVLVGNWL